MADSIVDVVTRVTFDVNDSELKAAGNAVKANINNINVLTQALQKQQQKLSETSRFEVQKRQQIQAAINNTKAAIDKETKSLENNIISNKALQQAIGQEIGLIGKLQAQLDTLAKKRQIATDPAKIKAYTQQIAQLQGQLTGLTSTGTGTGIGSQILSGLGLGGGFALSNLAVQGIGEVRQFLAESSRLAAETEGVKRAFDRLNSPNLLDNLREATKGTVSDLELMKNAVQFNNFGLPIDKLGVALDFARRRAKDTGVEVDYLVQSIVTGIGRQSPLILDNLGINAKRVASEFQRTGNFAEAAFKIIQEESQKAGADLETFAEKQARINSEIQNTQASFGKFINEFRGYLYSLGEDFLSANLGDLLDGTTATSRYLQNIRDLNNADNLRRQTQMNADALFLQTFQDFSDKYKNADYQTRQEIQSQAQQTYNKLLSDAKSYYANDIDQFNFYSESLKIAYQKLNQKFAQEKKFNLTTISIKDILGLTKEELTVLQEQIDNARNSITSGDSNQIKRLNNLADAVKKNLDIINGAVKEPKKKQNFVLKQLGFESESFEVAKRELESFIEVINKVLAPKGITPKTSGIFETPPAELSAKEAEKLQEQIRDAEIRRQTEKETREKEIKRKEDIEAKKRKTPIDELEEREKNVEKLRRERIFKAIDDYQLLAEAVVSAFNTIADAQQRQLDNEVKIRERRVDEATKLAEKGNTEALRIEQERLDEAYKKQEENAQRQAFLNNLLATSYAIVAVAKSAAEGGVFAPATIAATIAALIAGYSTIRSLSSEGFKKGGYTGDGNPNDEAGVVHKKEFVIPEAQTIKYRPQLEAMLRGNYNPVISTVAQYNNTTDVKELSGKLDAVIEAIGFTETKVNARFDEKGVALITERFNKLQKKRFR